MAKAKKSLGGSILETIKTIVYALILAGIFRSLFSQPFWIPSGSMKDTLLIGDFLFVNKMTYGYSYASCPSIIIPRFGINVDAEDFCGFVKGNNQRLFGGKPKRGDVVVFRHPVTGRDYIKRLIGLPGDKVQIKNGEISINDQAVETANAGIFVETYAPQGPFRSQPRCSNNPRKFGDDCEKLRLKSTLPDGRSFFNLNTVKGENIGNSIYNVPSGHYFFIGDNRDNSLDSRIGQVQGGVGFVPYENLVGRADRVMFSSAGRSMLFFWTWRSDRFFKAIR
ncbi:MAG: signal peptidase I [Rhodobacteraceae bacterium TMED111]|nr:signal peptidase I [Marinovum sp.]OUV39917.1 MAG: signal peptidase I [Rhodobacteraceae bacterium TMED111]